MPVAAPTRATHPSCGMSRASFCKLSALVYRQGLALPPLPTLKMGHRPAAHAEAKSEGAGRQWTNPMGCWSPGQLLGHTEFVQRISRVLSDAGCQLPCRSTCGGCASVLTLLRNSQRPHCPQITQRRTQASDLAAQSRVSSDSWLSMPAATPHTMMCWE